jgi:hypothetical protein
MGTYAADLYLEYQLLTEPVMSTTSKHTMVDEIADLILGENGYAGLSEPGMARLVRTQLRRINPTLNDFELHYHFREHFGEHFNELLTRWFDAYHKEREKEGDVGDHDIDLP